MSAAQPSDRAFLGATRARLLAVLEESRQPMTVRELAAAVALHPNSVREQLGALVDAGLVVTSRSSPAASSGASTVARGRPSHRYAARPHPDPSEPYRVLARVLAEQLASAPDAIATSLAAGERWGSRLVEAGMTGAPDRVPTSAEEGHERAIRRLVRVLDEAGFAPDSAVPDPHDVAGRPATIELSRCPFEPVGGDHRPVVCGVHLGMMRGVLRGIGAPVHAVSLEPYPRPGVCIARLAARPADRTEG